MHTLHYRRWCPPQSPLGIEFPPELFHEVRLEGAHAATAARLRRTRPRDRSEDHSSGVLFGLRQKQDVRILTARSAPDLLDPTLAGMQPVGIFVCRARGEVFLTDADLARFEAAQGLVALVVAGGRAGFFVREADGAVQAVKSHEEFAVANVSTGLAPATQPARMRPTKPPKRLMKSAMAGIGLLCVPMAVLAYLQPALPQSPVALAVREEAGQLIVGWDARGGTENGRLEIVDGGEPTIVHLSPDQTSVTYAHRTGDVEIRLATGTREGSARWEAVRYVAPIPPANRDADTAKENVVKLEQEAAILRDSMESARTRTAELSRRIGQLAAR
jgi:hypothetical protein